MVKKIQKKAAPARKYRSEFGLSAICSYAAILQDDGLDHASLVEMDQQHPFHIYMICRRPRVKMKREDLSWDSKEIRGTYIIHREDSTESHSFRCTHSFGANLADVQIHDGGNRISTHAPDGSQLGMAKSSLFLVNMCGLSRDHFDLEVLYIGQSYGEDGSRTAPKRLLHHETFQKILGEANRATPHMEIWIVLWSLDPAPVLISSMDGRAGVNPEIDGLADSKHADAVLDGLRAGQISTKVLVNFSEAALIKYFAPRFNTRFKDVFPSPAHDSYRACYDLDINAISVTLSTDECIMVRLFSDNVQAAWRHDISFPLHDRQTRVSMFDFVTQSDLEPSSK